MTGDGIELATAYIALVPSLQDKGLIRQVTSSGSKAGAAGGKKAGKSFGSELTRGVRDPLGKIAGIMAGAFAVEKVVDFGKELLGEAASYQKAITLLQTAGGEQRKNLGLISTGIINISDQVGTSADNLAEGMYTVEKAGYRGASGLTVLKNAAEGAAAENVDMATETNAVTSIMTSYHLKASQSAEAVNELVAASGAAKTTMQEFAGSLSSVLPLASASGISFAEVGGAVATLTQHGTSAHEATQHLNNTIRSLAAPNMVASKEMQQLGLNVNDLSKNLGKRGLTGTIDLVVDAIGHKMGKSGMVMLDAFRKSQSAGEDLQVMLSKMPKALRDDSQAFLDGKESLKDYTADVKGFGGPASAMGNQFKSLVGSSQGFNQLLASGSPAAQTYTDALKRIAGGATGMNTFLQLSGENMGAFKRRVDEVNKASKDSKSVSTWAATAATASVQMGRFDNTVKNLGLEAALAVLPTATKIVGGLADDLQKDGPAIKNWAKDTFGPWGAYIKDAGKLWHDTFDSIGSGGAASGLTTVSDLIKVTAHAGDDLVKVLDLIPGPIKGLTVDLYAGAIAFKVLSGTSIPGAVSGLKVWTAATIDADTRSTALGLAGLKVKSSLSSIGGAAKQAAGIGGMLALTSGMSEAHSQGETLGGTLKSILGGAATGFAIGGPIGALIGGAGGGALSLLVGGFHNSTGAAKINAQTLNNLKYDVVAAQIDNLRNTLDQATGAYTKNTKAAIDNWLHTDAVGKAAFASLQGAGASERTIMQAILGNPFAKGKLAADVKSQIGQLNTAIKDAQNQIKANNHDPNMSGAAVEDANNQLKAQIQLLSEQRDKFRVAANAVSGEGLTLKTAEADQRQFNGSAEAMNKVLGISAKQFAKLPKNVRLKVQADDIPTTSAQAEKLLHDLGKFATFREIKSIVSLPGAALSMQQIKDLQHQLHLTPPQVRTLVSAETAAASSALATIKSQLDGLHDKTVTVTTQQKYAAVHASPTHRAGGGPVIAGMPYIVGENRPELFVPDQNGRIIPRVPSTPRISRPGGRGANAARAAQPVTSGSGSVGVLTIDNWEDGTGYFEVLADGRVDAASTLAARIGRTNRP